MCDDDRSCTHCTRQQHHITFCNLLSPVRNFLSAHLQAGRRQTGADLWTLSCMDKRLWTLARSDVVQCNTWIKHTSGVQVGVQLVSMSERLSLMPATLFRCLTASLFSKSAECFSLTDWRRNILQSHVWKQKSSSGFCRVFPPADWLPGATCIKLCVFRCTNLPPLSWNCMHMHKLSDRPHNWL